MASFFSFQPARKNVGRRLQTQWGPKVVGLISFKPKTRQEDTNPFLLLKIIPIDIYRLLRRRTVLKTCRKIPLFGPSVIRQLRLLGSHQHPQSGVLLTSFSTWGTENSLAEINLEGSGDDKGL